MVGSSPNRGSSVVDHGDLITEQNDFIRGSRVANSHVSVGFWVDDLGSGFNRIRNNIFKNLAYGNSDKNANNQIGSLKYFCNTPTGNMLDITVHKAYQAPKGAPIAINQRERNQAADTREKPFNLSKRYFISYRIPQVNPTAT